jgi:beta-galactosidase/beta-glucuronidase
MLVNGEWDFCFDDNDEGLDEGWQRSDLPEYNSIRRHQGLPTAELIEVPFAFQTPASGINNRDAHEFIWYSKKLDPVPLLKGLAHGKRVLVRFGAVDYEVMVWLEGHFVGSHRGGHVPFEVDITDALDAQNYQDQLLVLRVRDSPDDLTQPRGKQYWAPKPEKIWYTPTSGIWQSVWTECVPRTRIGDSSAGTILRSNDIESGMLHAKVAIIGLRRDHNLTIQITASYGGSTVARARQKTGSLGYVNLDLDMRLMHRQLAELKLKAPDDGPWDESGGWKSGLALWSPEHPHLYDLSIMILNATGQRIDEVKTTVGMRSLNWTTGDGSFRLNGKPYFQALVLDQGYWPETGLTPPSEEALKKDIEISKAMGFNGCRKHQKVEDPIFLYWADRLGYLVWGEMANAYEFDDVYVDRFDHEWMEAVRRDINHPCVVTWTPGNESWGYKNLKDSVQERNHLRSLYYMTK